MANDAEDEQNLDAVLGLVKTIRIESLDASIRKSLEFLHSAIIDASKTYVVTQKDMVTLYTSGKDDAALRMEPRVDKLLDVITQATQALLGLTVQLTQSAMDDKDYISEITGLDPETEPPEAQ